MELKRLRAQLARVTMMRDIIKKATAYFAQEALLNYAWIARHKALWPVTLACEVLGISASGYFEHWRRKDCTKPSRPAGGKQANQR